MGDERLRALERAAAQGDPDAAEALSRERARHVDAVDLEEVRILREREVDLQAPALLSPELDRALARDLEPLGARASDALRFVTHGDVPEVLERVGREDRARLGLRSEERELINEGRLELLTELTSPPALVRLGLIYSAATGPWQREGPNWFHQLVAAGGRWIPPIQAYQPAWGSYEGVMTCATLIEVVDFAKEDSLPLLQLFFDALGGDWRFSQLQNYIRPEGVNELVERHPNYVSELLTERYYNGRVSAFESMMDCGVELEPFFAELGRLAGLGRRAWGRRHNVQNVFRERYVAGLQRPEIRACLESALREGTPDERVELATFIGEVCGQASRGALERAAARDRAPRVRKAASEALDAMTLLSGNPDLELDPLAPPGPLGEGAFRAAFRDQPELERAWTLLSESEPWAPLPDPLLSIELSEVPLNQLLDDFARAQDVQLGHVCRAVRLTGRLEAWEEDWRLRDQLQALDALARVWFETHGERASLSALGRAWGFLGLDERILGKVALTGDVIDRWLSAVNGWECADYYRRYPETLRDGLSNVVSGIHQWRRSLLDEVEVLVGQLQSESEGIPEPLHQPLVELALATAKSTRARGQKILVGEGDWLDEALVKELRARKAGRACAAARWLAERAPGHGGRVAAAELGLRRRLQDEKREKVREAIDEALASLPS